MPCIMLPCEETPGMQHCPSSANCHTCLESTRYQGMFKWNLWKRYPQDLNKGLLNTFKKTLIRCRRALSLNSYLKNLYYFPLLS